MDGPRNHGHVDGGNRTPDKSRATLRGREAIQTAFNNAISVYPADFVDEDSDDPRSADRSSRAVQANKKTGATKMSFDHTEYLIEGKIRPFAFIGPVDGSFILYSDGIEQRRFRVDVEDIYRLLGSIADQFSGEQEGPE